jgi:hypothetical protein
VSKIKTPHQKKQVSLERDRRRPLGAYDPTTHEKVSTKKARINRAHRHEVHQRLHVDGAPVEELDLDQLEVGVRTSQRERFQKPPALPLVEFIERQKGDRTKRAGTHAPRAAAAKAKKAAREAKQATARKAKKK